MPYVRRRGGRKPKRRPTKRLGPSHERGSTIGRIRRQKGRRRRKVR